MQTISSLIKDIEMCHVAQMLCFAESNCISNVTLRKAEIKHF